MLCVFQSPPLTSRVYLQFFQQVDTDRSGHIDVLELQRALQMAGLSFSQQLCAQMIRLHDRSRRKVINFTVRNKRAHQGTLVALH